MLWRAAWVAFLVFLMSGAPIHAQLASQWKFCTGNPGVDWDVQIKNCTVLIESPGENGGNRAIAYYNRGNAWYQKGHPDRAIADYNEAIRLNPKYGLAYFNRGYVWSTKDDLHRAIADFTETIRFNPKFVMAYLNRGVAKVQQADYDQAMADYNEAIRLNPKYALVYLNLGNLWSAKGETNRAIADYSTAIRLNPKFAVAYYNRGRARLYAAAPAAALADLNQANALAPNNAYGVLWVDIAGHRNKVPSRLAALSKAIDMSKWPAPVVRLFLGQSTPAAVVAAANNSVNKIAYVCEARFYSGEWVQWQGNRPEAVRLFRLAAAECPRNANVRTAARAELKALGETP